MSNEKMPPVHPGEILSELYMKPLGLSQNSLAAALKVPPRRINEIVNRKRRITADTALRLARFFRMTPQYWMGLQLDFELDLAQDKLQEKIERDIIPCETCH